MTELRTATAEHHERAEHHPFQRDLAKGRASVDLYASYLGQLLLVHRALWSALTLAASHDARIAAVVEPWQHDEPRLLEDLASFGVDPCDVSPSPSTESLVAHIGRLAASNPVSLLGMHYVLEGSKNGGRFIAVNVRRAYALEGPAGTRYLDPYGEAPSARWQAFKASMDAQVFTSEEHRSMADAARGMFDAIAAISDDVLDAVAA